MARTQKPTPTAPRGRSTKRGRAAPPSHNTTGKATQITSRRFTRRDWLILGALTVLAALTRFLFLSWPPEIVFDETYFANFAHNYLTNTKFFDAEPPLAKFIIASGEWLFGFNSFGWRFMPALFGTAVIPLMYLFVKRLFGGVLMPTLAAALALMDGLLLVESRVAVIDIFVVFFNLLTYSLFLLSLQASTRKKSGVFLAATGVSLGLGLAVKWITLAFIGPAIVLLALLYARRTKFVKKAFKFPLRSKGDELLAAIGANARNVHTPATYVILLGLLPAMLYILIFLIHVPFDSTGEGIIGIHKQIFNYHHNLTATHPYGSAWYTWPLAIRPVAYYFQSGAPGASTAWQTIIAIGNPLIWWSGVVAAAFTVYRFIRTRNVLLGFVLFALLAHFGPWALIDRVLFIYHYMGGLPFTIIALSYVLVQSWHWRPKDNSFQVFGWALLAGAGALLGGLLGRSLYASSSDALAYGAGALLVTIPLVYFALANVRNLRWGQKQVIVFMGIITLAFLYFLPIWTGAALQPEDYYRRIWLKSWI